MSEIVGGGLAVGIGLGHRGGRDMNLLERLRAHDIQPSAQRIAIARYVLDTTDHPSAEQVLERAQASIPALSRATVYATLSLFVDKGLLRRVQLEPGRIVYDPHVAHHHHFIDERGEVLDLPAEALQVVGVEALEGLEVDQVEVVLRGRRKG
ncbi:MAG: transcriptional repressor [Myxococcales bacterium]|nr:transcriptional repressor [Myxococcales bacterium]